MGNDQDMMQKLVSLCKRRGFVFQSSEIYDGPRSGDDYGPPGVEAQRNPMKQWGRRIVHSPREIR